MKDWLDGSPGCPTKSEMWGLEKQCTLGSLVNLKERLVQSAANKAAKAKKEGKAL